MAWCRGPAGVEERGMYGRVPQEPGRPGRPRRKAKPPSGASSERSRGVGESECRRTSKEVGEPTRGTPRSKGRHRIKEPLEGKMAETPGLETVSTKQERIAKQAREAPAMAFKTLAHHIDIEWMKEAYRRTRKDGATGVDGQTAEQYAANLEVNLGSL